MIIPHAKPGNSTATITGEWKAYMPIVNSKLCIKCGICQNMCPEGIMGEVKKVPEIDYDYCKGCNICADQCPINLKPGAEKCIEMVRIEEGLKAATSGVYNGKQLGK